MTYINAKKIKLPTLPKEVSERLLELSKESTDLQTIFFDSLKEHPNTEYFQFMQTSPDEFAVAWLFNKWHVEGEGEDKVTSSDSVMVSEITSEVIQEDTYEVKYSEHGTLFLVMEEIEENLDGRKIAMDICEIVGEYGVNEPDAIQSFWGGYMVSSTSVANGNHNKNSLVSLYDDLNKIEGLNVVSFKAKYESGQLKLSGGKLKEAKYETSLGDYNVIK